MIAPSKLSPALVSKKASAGPEDLLEVVLELRPTAPSAARAGKAAIEARRSAFERDSSPVEDAVRKVGGRVLGSVWLNHTLKVLVPSRALDELCGLAAIRALDVPHPLHPDAR